MNLNLINTENIAICGIDEAGRGCVAGSLFVCGVVFLANFPKDLKVKMRDSKSLSPKARFDLAPQIREFAEFCLIEKTAAEIDKYGLSNCLKAALCEILVHFNNTSILDSIKTIESNRTKPQNRELNFIFDGNCSFNLPLQTLIKGDSKIAEISAASILAKVAKDSQMQEFAVDFPQYNFAKNKGYLSAEHLCAIEKFGPCEIHRKSYKIRALRPEHSLLFGE